MRFTFVMSLALSMLLVGCSGGPAPSSQGTERAPPRASATDAGPGGGSLWPSRIEPLTDRASPSEAECLARHRASLSTGVAEAIADLHYDRFFDDVCVSERALAARDPEVCAPIVSSPIEAGCRMRVAVLTGTPERCPVGPDGRDELCLAFSTGEVAFCETAMTRDRARCRASLQDDPRLCRSAMDVALCEATVARYAGLVAARRRGHTLTTRVAVHGERKDAPGEVELALPQGARGVRLVPEGCDYRVRIEDTSARYGTRPALITLAFAVPSNASFPLRIPVNALTLEVRARERTLDQTLGAAGELVVTRLDARRLGSLDFTFDVTLRDGDERWQLTADVHTFVRDLDPARCTP